jgi:hypothetical protein
MRNKKNKIKDDEKDFEPLFAKLDEQMDSLFNPKSDICTDYSGCAYQKVCDKNTRQCSVVLEIEGKPLPPKCQNLILRLRQCKKKFKNKKN